MNLNEAKTAKIEVIEIKGMPGCPCLCLSNTGEPIGLGSERRMPVAAQSWHREHDGYITCPASGEYREDWLCDVFGGTDMPSPKLAIILEAWLDSADLSSLCNADDYLGHKVLCDSLRAAIEAA